MSAQQDNEFWKILDQLVTESSIIIDRPKNSEHPDWESVNYPLDYGYLAGTISADGSGIDVWLGAGGEKRVTGVIYTVDGLKRDVEVKVLLGCTVDEMDTILAFHCGDNVGCQLVKR